MVIFHVDSPAFDCDCGGMGYRGEKDKERYGNAD